MTRLILASASPQRSALLAQIGIPHDSIPASIEEIPDKREKPSAFVARIATRKAKTVAEQYPNCFVLGADTVVQIGTKILGKPENTGEAQTYLQRLSGRRHRVVSGVCLITPVLDPRSGSEHFSSTRVCLSYVAFKRLTDKEIETYIATQEWQKRAGGYAIQGRASAFIRFISGSYSNIVGLPLFETTQILKGRGFPL